MLSFLQDQENSVEFNIIQLTSIEIQQNSILFNPKEVNKIQYNSVIT